MLFWCWLQELICSSADILPAESSTAEQQQMRPMKSNINKWSTSQPCGSVEWPANAAAMFSTLSALITIANECGKLSRHTKPSTNTNTDDTNSEKPLDQSIDWPDAVYDSTDEYETIDSHDIENLHDHTKTVNNAANICDLIATKQNRTVELCSAIEAITNQDEVDTNLSLNNNASCMRKAPNTLNLLYSNNMFLNVNASETIAIKKRRVATKRSYHQMNAARKYTERLSLNGIIEECEYDSDIGKFKCKTNQIMSDNSSDSYDFVDGTSPTNEESSDGEVTLNDTVAKDKLTNPNVEEMDEEAVTMKKLQESEEPITIVNREFIENLQQLKCDEVKEEKHVSTALCLTTFFVAVFLLYFFPLSSKK